MTRAVLQLCCKWELMSSETYRLSLWRRAHSEARTRHRCQPSLLSTTNTTNTSEKSRTTRQIPRTFWQNQVNRSDLKQMTSCIVVIIIIVVMTMIASSWSQVIHYDILTTYWTRSSLHTHSIHNTCSSGESWLQTGHINTCCTRLTINVKSMHK